MTPLNDDGLGSGPSIAEVLIGGMRNMNSKMDSMIANDAAQKQSLSDMNIRLTNTEKTVAEHQALKNKAGGVLVIGSMVLGFIGVAFWKIIDIFLNSKGINTGGT